MGIEKELEPYSDKEELLRKWEARILSVSTKRTALLQTMLNIIHKKDTPENRLEEFNKLRSKLLSTNHGQGWTWTPSRLLPIILSCLPAAWRAVQSGSQLRNVLEKEPLLNTNLLNLTKASKFLSNKTFEEKIFSDNSDEHQIALRDLLILINQLKQTQDAGKECLLSHIKIALDRANAIKFRLTSTSYLQLLEGLFQRFPVESFTYYYQIYLRDHQEIPEAQNYMEYHLMVNVLMQSYVLAEETHSFQRFYMASELLMVLIYKPQALLNKSDPKPGHKTTLIDLSTIYDKTQDSLGLKQEIVENLKRLIIDEASASKHSTKAKSEMPLIPSNPLGVLEHVLKYSRSKSKIKSQPLIILFARKACEVFLQGLQLADLKPHAEMKNWKDFCQIMLSTLASIFEPTITKEPNFSDIHSNIALLDPMLNCLTIPTQYRRAEKYALEIILRMTIPWLNKEFPLAALRKINLENPSPFSEEEYEWLAHRIGKAAPPGLISKMDLKKNLSAKPQFNLDALSRLANLPISLKTPLEAHALLKQGLQTNSYEEWEEAVREVAVFFDNYLTTCSNASVAKSANAANSLEMAADFSKKDLLAEMKPYLSWDLFEHWETRLSLLEKDKKLPPEPEKQLSSGSPSPTRPQATFFASNSSANSYLRLGNEAPKKPVCTIL